MNGFKPFIIEFDKGLFSLEVCFGYQMLCIKRVAFAPLCVS